MTCAQLEILLCDYVDGALAPAEKLAVEQHLASCALCAEMARDGAAAIDFMTRVAEVEPPPALVTQLFHLPGLELARPQARGGFRGWLQSLKQPMLQPRMAMGLTLTVLFFGLMARCAGMPERHLTSADLDPARVLGTLEDRANRTWQRSLKFYESIRLVYKIQTQLRDWKEQQDADAAVDSNADDRRLSAPANKQAKPAEAPAEAKQ
jgi:anti-sigma factor RsiW